MDSLVPSNTSIKDFAYSETHPLYTGAHDEDMDQRSTDEDEYEVEEEEYSSDEINRKAVALFDFVPENDNEVGLREGQLIWISYRHGQGWLVAEDPETGENGLVPEEYVEIWDYDEERDEAGVIDEEVEQGRSSHVTGGGGGVEEEDDDTPKRFLPNILHYEEEEWVDTDDEEESENHHR
ncbi:NAP1-binding protein 2 [[Candida] anglica]|uniref:NAP1-binding protein 2 n=1 Tax=[Candida] anglica TaxID=148631 RepID=A0ABP0EA50_9ASCO